MTEKDIVTILKKGGVGVIPTDTIYAIAGSALLKEAVEKIYRIRRREKGKPFIVLISSLSELKKFGVRLGKKHSLILKKIWPGSVSVILPVSGKKFFYLHRGKNSIAFRLPAEKKIRKFLKKSGPLVAPSANIAGQPPAETVSRARNYFGDKADFYIDEGQVKGGPSSIIEFKR